MLSLDSSGIDLSPTSLNKAVEKAIELIENRLEHKELKLNLNLSPQTILCDEASLVYSVILNLLTNAIKFSFRGGSIDIKVTEHDDQTTLLQITDHGMGIPDYILSELFDINAKVTRPGTEDEAGTGFAMPLIKKFVDAYQATLKITSQTHEDDPQQCGTTFDIYFKKAAKA
jgi:signal transduction histidine kinase